MRRFGLALGVLVLAAMMTLMMFGLAAAERPPYGPPEGTAGPPRGSCPASAGWELVVPSGPEHLSAAYDFNTDGVVCARSLAGDTAITFMDNVVR